MSSNTSQNINNISDILFWDVLQDTFPSRSLGICWCQYFRVIMYDLYLYFHPVVLVLEHTVRPSACRKVRRSLSRSLRFIKSLISISCLIWSAVCPLSVWDTLFSSGWSRYSSNVGQPCFPSQADPSHFHTNREQADPHIHLNNTVSTCRVSETWSCRESTLRGGIKILKSISVLS